MTEKIRSATLSDINNIEACAAIIEHAVAFVPAKLREAVLSRAIEKVRETNNGPKSFRVSDLMSKELPNRHAEMRLKALVVQRFVRDIANNHSKDEAGEILYSEQLNGTGSGWLPDYLPPYRPRRLGGVTFKGFLSEINAKEDAVGDLIRDLRDDPKLPEAFEDKASLVGYLHFHNACDGALEAANKLWKRYRSWVAQQGANLEKAPV